MSSFLALKEKSVFVLENKKEKVSQNVSTKLFILRKK